MFLRALFAKLDLLHAKLDLALQFLSLIAHQTRRIMAIRDQLDALKSEIATFGETLDKHLASEQSARDAAATTAQKDMAQKEAEFEAEIGDLRAQLAAMQAKIAPAA